MPIRCEIVSQDRMVYEGDADMVLLPGVEGEMGILPNHAPLLTTLKFGIIRVRAGGNEQVFTVAMRDGRPAGEPERVTNAATWATFPRFLADGRLVFLSGDTGGKDIWIADPRGGPPGW